MSEQEREMSKIISDNIKKLMERNDINQSDLARILEVSESTVGKWILQKAVPRMGIIQKLSDYFNVPKSYFFETKNYDPDAVDILNKLEKNGDLKMLFSKVADLDEEDKEQITQIIKSTLKLRDDD